MIKHISMCLSLIFLTSLLMSCTSQSDDSSSDIEKKFQAMMPIEDMNKSIQLQLNSDKYVFASGSDIPLIFKNVSSNTIFFATDRFIKLLILDNNDWLEVRNKNTYSGFLQLSPQGTALRDFNRAMVRPLIGERMDDNGKEILLRVVIFGEIIENDMHTGEFVGAYVDLYIAP